MGARGQGWRIANLRRPLDDCEDAGTPDLALGKVLEIGGCLAQGEAANDGRKQHIYHLATCRVPSGMIQGLV